jgi:hypothetical protein
MRATCFAAIVFVAVACLATLAEAQRLPPVAPLEGTSAATVPSPAASTFATIGPAPKTASPAPLTYSPAARFSEVKYDDRRDEFGNLLDNTSFSVGAEAFKTSALPYYRGFYFAETTSAGVVSTVNTAFQIVEGSPIRAQAGISYGVFDFKGGDFRSHTEQQLFITLGVSKRSNVLQGDRLSWGLVWDQLLAYSLGDGFSDFSFSQSRALLGWALNTRNEIGFWGAFRTSSYASGRKPRPADQYNMFWRHNYDFGGQSMFWIGGNDPADYGSWLVGGLGESPLNNYLSLTGNFTFALPGASAGMLGAAQEAWAVGVGLTYYVGAKSVRPSVSGRQGLPLIPVANNGTFLLTY